MGNELGQDSPDSTAINGKKLLRLARSAIEQYLREGKIPVSRPDEHVICHGSGLFVTIWQEASSQTAVSLPEERVLRGCIGHLQSNLPIYDFVQEIAIGAATRDPRFPPLSLAELESITLEIAVLSPLRPITDLKQIKIGEDGLLIEGMGKRGLLLPKVATRLGWDRQRFLEGVCYKAGLPLDSWPKASKLYAFKTVSFDECAADDQVG